MAGVMACTRRESSPPAESQQRCTSMTGETIALSGRAQREAYYGPPGYGEDSVRDQRDTVWILRLSAPLLVCSEPGSSARGSAEYFSRVQLVGNVPPVSDSISGGAHWTGVLERAELPWHHTGVIFRVAKGPASPRS